MSLMDRAKRAYNILRDDYPTEQILPLEYRITSIDNVAASVNRLRYDTSKSVLAPIQNRISIDASNVPIRHVLVDEYKQFLFVKESELNSRLTYMANIDQTGRAFIQDAVQSMLSEGAIALVPVEVSSNPRFGGSWDILSMRVGTISEWFNYSVRVNVYNELTGEREDKTLPKSFVAICYNPMYSVMNESNSTMKRLIDALALLDVADSRFYSPGLDLIVQLPYAVKTDKREAEAARRLDALEEQLKDRAYGIGYIDATEKVTQLNRPATNTLMDKVKTLTEALHNQLGLTPAIFSGTATQAEMIAYNNRTLLPVLNAIIDPMIGTFFTQTGITQGNSIMAFPNLFKMAPIDVVSESADKLTRNEIMSSNEVRAAIGLPKSMDTNADELRNKNLNKSDNVLPEEMLPEEEPLPDEQLLEESNL
jgi:hypothetical protein